MGPLTLNHRALPEEEPILPRKGDWGSSPVPRLALAGGENLQIRSGEIGLTAMRGGVLAGTHDLLYSRPGWEPVRAMFADCVAHGGCVPSSRAAMRWAPPTLPVAQEGGRSTWAITLAYRGEAFRGFAWQPEARTVAAVLQTGLTPLLEGRHACVVACAGRTDAGVSALGQVVSFYSWPDLQAEDVVRAIDDAAPGDCVARAVQRVPRSFHAGFSATWRWYVYVLPLACAEELDVAALHAALRRIEGRWDFSALGRGLPKGKSGECVIHHASAETVVLGGGVVAARIDVVGSRFIRRQVRTLVATAVHSLLHDDPGDDSGLLRRATSGDQRLTAPPAPADGLCFYGAGYGGDFLPAPASLV